MFPTLSYSLGGALTFSSAAPAKLSIEFEIYFVFNQQNLASPTSS